MTNEEGAAMVAAGRVPSTRRNPRWCRACGGTFARYRPGPAEPECVCPPLPDLNIREPDPPGRAVLPGRPASPSAGATPRRPTEPPGPAGSNKQMRRIEP